MSGSGLQLGPAAPAPSGGSAPAPQAGVSITYNAGGGSTVGSVFDFGTGHAPSQNAGGAPSPEVNAGLGLILAGGTVAFLRRRARRPDRAGGLKVR